MDVSGSYETCELMSTTRLTKEENGEEHGIFLTSPSIQQAKFSRKVNKAEMLPDLFLRISEWLPLRRRAVPSFECALCQTSYKQMCRKFISKPDLRSYEQRPNAKGACLSVQAAAALSVIP